MIMQVTAVDFRKSLEEMLDQVRNRHGSVLISEDGKPVAALVDARLFDRIRRMQARFDALYTRIESGFSETPEGVGIAGIDAAIAEDRRTQGGSGAA